MTSVQTNATNRLMNCSLISRHHPLSSLSNFKKLSLQRDFQGNASPVHVETYVCRKKTVDLSAVSVCLPTANQRPSSPRPTRSARGATIESDTGVTRRHVCASAAMKVPSGSIADDADSAVQDQSSHTRASTSSIFGHRSCDCLIRMPTTRDRNSPPKTGINHTRESYPALSGLGSRKSMGSALLDPGDFTSTRRSSRLPSQQDQDSCVAPSARDRVKTRMRCVYCGAIMGCVLGLALLVGAGLSFAIYLGCLSVDAQRTAWLRRNRLLPLPNATARPLNLPPAVQQHLQQQHHTQETLKLQFRTGIVLTSLGLAALVCGIVCCCLHPIASEHRRRPLCGCFRRPIKLTSASGPKPRQPDVSAHTGIRNNRSVSTGGASPQHLLAVFSAEQGGREQDVRTPRTAFFRRFSFL